jgi:hypothetical protein
VAWSDPVGTDVGERLRPVRVNVSLEYRVESGRPRHRGDRTYQREEVKVERSVRLNFSSAVLDPGSGPAAIATGVAQQLYRRLTFEGWPVKQREAE